MPPSPGRHRARRAHRAFLTLRVHFMHAATVAAPSAPQGGNTARPPVRAAFAVARPPRQHGRRAQEHILGRGGGAGGGGSISGGLFPGRYSKLPAGSVRFLAAKLLVGGGRKNTFSQKHKEHKCVWPSRLCVANGRGFPCQDLGPRRAQERPNTGPRAPQSGPRGPQETILKSPTGGRQ